MNIITQGNWDVRFLKLAREVASWSKDQHKSRLRTCQRQEGRQSGIQRSSHGRRIPSNALWTVT